MKLYPQYVSVRKASRSYKYLSFCGKNTKMITGGHTVLECVGANLCTVLCGREGVVLP